MSVSEILEFTRRRKLVDWLTSLTRDNVLLALLVSFLVLNNAIWLRADKSPPQSDAARYLVKSLEALDTIRSPSPDVVQRLYYQNHYSRPTFAFVAFAIPFYLLLGPTPDVAILGTNTIFYAIIVFATYGLGKLIFDRRVGLLAAFVVSVNPEVWDLSRRYWPHFSVIAIVALGAYLLLRSDNFESKKHVLAFGVALGIGLLMRPAYAALFLVGPALFIAVKALFSDVAAGTSPTIRSAWHQLLRNFRSRIVCGLLPALLIVAGLAGPFYLRYSAEIFAKVARKQNLEVKPHLADYQSFSWYLSGMDEDMSLFFFVLFVIGVGCAFIMLASGKHRARNGLLLFWFAISYILLSLPAPKAFFYFAPAYLAVAILSVSWIFCLNNKALQRILIGVVLVMGLFTFTFASWNIPPLPRPIRRALKIGSHPPSLIDLRIREIVDFLGQQGSLSDPIRVGVISDQRSFADASFAYYTKLQGLDIEYVREWDPWSTLLDTDYVVVRTPVGATGSHTNVRALSHVLDNQQSAFYTTYVLIRELGLRDGAQAQVYRRVRPLSCEEIVAISGELIRLDPSSRTSYLWKLEQLPCLIDEDIQHPLWRSLGGVVAFLGYNMDQRDLQSGELLHMTLWWQALDEMDRDYTAFLHVVDQDDRIWAQQDRLLQHRGLPTSGWPVGGIVREEYELELAADIPAGEYIVKTGTYYWQTVERLPVWDENGSRVSGDTISLQSATVTDWRGDQERRLGTR